MRRVTEITSRHNPWFRRFARAVERHGDEIVLEGRRFVQDVIRRRHDVVAVAGRNAQALDDVAQGDFQPLLLEEALFREIADAATSQGIVALVRRPVSGWENISWQRPLVVLDGVQDPGNVGTIIRLAVAFGAGGVLCTEGTADPWGPKALRASAASILDVAVVRVSSDEILNRLADNAVERLIADAAGEIDGTVPNRVAFVFGSEGTGVSGQFRESARTVGIATSGRVESLNVASAAAILLSREWDRRRSLAPASLGNSPDATH